MKIVDGDAAARGRRARFTERGSAAELICGGDGVRAESSA
jgi:hypothetical protein